NDCSQAASLIAKVPNAEVIIADKGYDTEAIRAQVEQQGSKVVEPPRVSRRPFCLSHATWADSVSC
ncbi:hypothetical protein NLO85_28755, partial [Pseudomonas savastanoi]|nr:hypothetical protein [Pseudomonas savastanoi]